LAALLVLGTHAAFATGKLTHGYLGLVYARLEIGVPIFFVLSGFLLFRPWVRAAAAGLAAPSVRHYARRRLRRIMPAYLVTVLLAYYCSRSSWLAWCGVSALVEAVTAALFGVCEDN
jgi:peptidoglycan/LPS O-acetylase OafA/YrhL